MEEKECRRREKFLQETKLSIFVKNKEGERSAVDITV